MNEFLSALGNGVVGIPLRPLLYMAGAAATAAGIYYYVKRADGKETTSDPEVTTEDPVCDQATEPALLQPAEVPQHQLTDAVTKAEEKIQKLVVSNTQLEERVRELEELLCEACRDDMKSKVSLAEAEEKHQTAVETIAQLKLEKSSLKDQVETRQGTVQYMGNLLHPVEVEKSGLKDQVETLRGTVQDMGNLLHAVEVEKSGLKDQVETLRGTVQDMGNLLHAVEVEKSGLKDQVETLRGTVQDMENMLSETHTECDKLMNECECEREDHNILKYEYEEMKETLNNKEELLKVSLSEAEEKHQMALETIAELKVKKSGLKDQVKTLQGRMELTGNVHNETYQCAIRLMTEIQVKDDEMKRLIDADKIVKVTLPEAEEEHQKDVETIAQLKVEKSDLKDQVESLQERVRYTENLLRFVELEKSDLTSEMKRLQRRVQTVVKHVCETDWEIGTRVYLQLKNDEMNKRLIDAEELLKVNFPSHETMLLYCLCVCVCVLVSSHFGDILSFFPNTF
ncbi:myosin heavy chain, striated muscle-like isoform X2 [Ictalurus furcatus]|uniref:myosin heavy chain, striated muscle-like isoform X2 n=1 Tax=Ictalurus furcatus TaxID=66913 RepID=UPI002350D24E|nr:myosin heavy chain, striated muscle-like isoform X2 [Ictalurus furcatus]